MKRTFPWVAIVAASTVSAAACSSGGNSSHPIADLQKTCALVTACTPGNGLFNGVGFNCELLDAYNSVDPSTFGQGAELTLHELQCLNAASDCAGIQACLTVPAAQAAVCTGTTMPRCSGTYLVECGNTAGGMTVGQDCSTAGLVCAENAEGATCATAACDPATTKPTCDGDKLVACQPVGGGLVAEPCPFLQTTQCSSSGGCTTQIGETCGIAGGVATCMGTGPACDASTFKASCDGTTIVTCTGGKTSRVDCSQLDPSATCVQSADGSVACGGAGKECTDTTPETCSNGVVTYCMWGTKTTLDCKAYGLSGCAVYPNSMPATAHCTP